MRCARCNKLAADGEVFIQVLWQRGPNGNRRYVVCQKCANVIESVNETGNKKNVSGESMKGKENE